MLLNLFANVSVKTNLIRHAMHEWAYINGKNVTFQKSQEPKNLNFVFDAWSLIYDSTN